MKTLRGVVARRIIAEIDRAVTGSRKDFIVSSLWEARKLHLELLLSQ